MVNSPILRGTACKVHAVSRKSELDCENQLCHLDPPSQCFCYTVGTCVTHRRSEGQGEVEKQKQKCPLSLLWRQWQGQMGYIYITCQVKKTATNNTDILPHLVVFDIQWQPLPEMWTHTPFMRKLCCSQPHTPHQKTTRQDTPSNMYQEFRIHFFSIPCFWPKMALLTGYSRNWVS